MKSRVLVLGKGFIGSRIQEDLDCLGSGAKISSIRDAERIIKRYNPKILINCIGSVGRNNVDGCEQDKDKTLFANAFCPIILAEVALRHKIKLIHISTGCIFKFDYEHDRPISESKIPDFFDLYYSRTKIYSERALEILSSKFNILIIRIRVPLDTRPHPRNILTKIIGYKKVINLPNSITYIPDFLRALRHLIKIDARGIYNIANTGGLAYPRLLDIYKKYDSSFNYNIVDYKTLNMVRTNLILSVNKLSRSGFKPRHINRVLEECVREYLKY